MKNSTLFSKATFAVLIASAMAATPLKTQAITIVNSFEIDLSLTTITNDFSGGQLILGVLPTLVPVTPFIPSVGDILQTTISFKNGDRLKIIDGPNVVDSIGPDYFESLTFYFKSSGLDGGGTTETTSVSYANLLGDLLPDPNGTSTGVLGQTIPTPNSTNTFISFTGLTLTTRIDGLGVSDPFDQFGLFGGRAGGYEVIPGMIPEPPTYALLGLGFAVSGISMYRRVSKRPASKPAL